MAEPSARIAAALRELAKANYRGVLSTSVYRRERTRLLDELAAGDGDMALSTVPRSPEATTRARAATRAATGSEAAAPPAPAKSEPKERLPRAHPPAREAAEPRSSAPPRPAPEAAAPAPARGRLTGIAVAGLLLIAVIVAFLLSGGERPADPSPASAAADRPSSGPGQARTTAMAPGQPTGAEALVQEFLREGDWSAVGIGRLRLAWRALPRQEAAEARSQAWFRPLEQAVKQRVLDQQAYADLNPSREASDADRALLSLAQELGTPVSLAGSDDTAPRRQEPPGNPRPPAAAASGPPDAAGAVTSVPPAQASEPLQEVPEVRPSTPDRAPDTTADAAPPVEAQVVTEIMPEPAVVPAATALKNGCSATLLEGRRRSCRDPLSGGGEGPTMVVVPAGSFVMGSEAAPEEGPPHEVMIAAPIAVSVHEVSGGEFGAFCRATGRSCPGSPWGNDDQPAVNVSWHDATGYAAWLSELAGASYRLPTEAEWEYLARGGSATTYPLGEELSPADARFSMATPLARDNRAIRPNGFRIYHAVGNVREWVADGWNPSHAGAPSSGAARNGGDQRVVRGGSYADGVDRLRSSARQGLPADTRDAFTGFRLVRDLSE